MPAPTGETGGGMANAIVGTGISSLIASAIGLPIGIGAGLYLAEQRGAKLATAVRFLSDVLNGLPSIVLGIFAWQLLVRPFKHFSALAGGIALAAMMIPLVTRATEEMIRLVPGVAARGRAGARLHEMANVVERRAAHGASWHRHGRPGGRRAHRRRNGAAALHGLRQPVLVGVTDAAHRCATACRSTNTPLLPTTIGIAQAWAGALVLLGLVLVISLAARFVTRSRFGLGGD